MYKEKRFLAIIPARSGSKGLPNKNIKLLANKPLMAYTIEACLQASIFDEIIVSTDSKAYADIALAYGASVPSLRPRELGSDTATIQETILYVLEEQKALGKEYEYFMLLQPTSPLRKSEHILESIELLIEKKANAVISVCQEEHARNISIPFNKEGILDGAFTKAINTRRQAQQLWIRLNGAIYLCDIKYYFLYKDFYKEKSYFYMMNRNVSIDIDTIEQFEYVEWLMEKNKSISK